MQTSVEWLVDMLKQQGLLIGEPDNLITVKKAIKMEKQQHGNTWDSAIEQFCKRGGNLSRASCDFDDYFAETFRSRESGMSEKPTTHTEKEIIYTKQDVIDSVIMMYDIFMNDTLEAKKLRLKGISWHIQNILETIK